MSIISELFLFWNVWYIYLFIFWNFDLFEFIFSNFSFKFATNDDLNIFSCSSYYFQTDAIYLIVCLTFGLNYWNLRELISDSSIKIPISASVILTDPSSALLASIFFFALLWSFSALISYNNKGSFPNLGDTNRISSLFLYESF